MKERIEPGLINDLKTYGVDVGNWNDCFHCGNCTALCPLTEKGVLFPRKQIRLLQIGLEKDLTSSIEPWMCYYCGDCSKSCPRDANPGELMMSLRRWLTTVYDWTGISKLIYKSKALEIAAIIGIAIVVGILYIRFTANPFINTQQYVVDGKVMINDLAPAWKIHIGDWIMAGMVAFLLFTPFFYILFKGILRKKKKKKTFFFFFSNAFFLS
ncbi:MAG: 4Fe-4S dicluster domain-containing protein, partial [Deltaproteobacteria bacterium]|nr:4Fe-4S dicluster domain-containing protein [Deltaproteobacteria bacterium]